MRVALIFLCLAVAVAPLRADEVSELRGTVVMVSEGDLLTLVAGESTMTVRLQGIDCPEPDQPFGDKARQLTARLVLGKKVSVALSGGSARGRPLARICQEARCLDEELLRAGLAWCEKGGGGELRRLEQQARAAKRGLWVEAKPIAPWEWRKSHGSSTPGPGSAGGYPTVDVTHSVCVDQRSKLAHWYKCPQARGLSCKLDSGWQARSAGYGLHSCLDEQPAPVSDERSCKRDSECTFRPLPRCGCPPCGDQRREAVSLKTAEATRRQHAQQNAALPCPRVRCARCAAPLRWLGTRAVCTRSRCEVR